MRNPLLERARELERQRDYEGAAAAYAQHLAGLAIESASTENLDILLVTVSLGRLHVEHALHAQGEERLHLFAEAERVLLCTDQAFLQVDLTQLRTPAEIAQRKPSTCARARTAARNGHVWLAVLHSLAAASPRNNWNPAQDHRQQVNIHAQAALDYAVALPNARLAVQTCVEAVRCAVVAGDDALAEAWATVAEQVLERLVDPVNAAGANAAYSELPPARDYEQALGFISLQFGATPQSVVGE